MPICKKCNTKFPNRIYIDGVQKVLNSRKYCLKCSPFGLHNTKTLDDVNLDENGFSTCSQCNKKYIYERGRGHRKTKCNCCASNVSQRRIQQKEKSVEYKGGSCKICGYNKCIAALVFHHRDDVQKDFAITGITRAWNKIKIELDKCDLLCCRCHSEIHYDLQHN